MDENVSSSVSSMQGDNNIADKKQTPIKRRVSFHSDVIHADGTTDKSSSGDRSRSNTGSPRSCLKSPQTVNATDEECGPTGDDKRRTLLQSKARPMTPPTNRTGSLERGSKLANAKRISSSPVSRIPCPTSYRNQDNRAPQMKHQMSSDPRMPKSSTLASIPASNTMTKNEAPPKYQAKQIEMLQNKPQTMNLQNKEISVDEKLPPEETTKETQQVDVPLKPDDKTRKTLYSEIKKSTDPCPSMHSSDSEQFDMLTDLPKFEHTKESLRRSAPQGTSTNQENPKTDRTLISGNKTMKSLMDSSDPLGDAKEMLGTLEAQLNSLTENPLAKSLLSKSNSQRMQSATRLQNPKLSNSCSSQMGAMIIKPTDSNASLTDAHKGTNTHKTVSASRAAMPAGRSCSKDTLANDKNKNISLDNNPMAAKVNKISLPMGRPATKSSSGQSISSNSSVGKGSQINVLPGPMAKHNNTAMTAHINRMNSARAIEHQQKSGKGLCSNDLIGIKTGSNIDLSPSNSLTKIDSRPRQKSSQTSFLNQLAEDPRRERNRYKVEKKRLSTIQYERDFNELRQLSSSFYSTDLLDNDRTRKTPPKLMYRPMPQDRIEPSVLLFFAMGVVMIWHVYIFIFQGT